MGFFGEIAKAAFRLNHGMKEVGADGYSLENNALDALFLFGTNREKAVRYLTEGEARRYDELVKEYPGGYDEYCKKRDERREKERLMNRARYDADPMSAWVEDLTNEERNRKSVAKWNKAVDRDRGIYRPDSNYGL